MLQVIMLCLILTHFKLIGGRCGERKYFEGKCPRAPPPPHCNATAFHVYRSAQSANPIWNVKYVCEAFLKIVNYLYEIIRISLGSSQLSYIANLLSFLLYFLLYWWLHPSVIVLSFLQSKSAFKVNLKVKGVLHPRLVFGLFLHFSQKLKHTGNK